jgi:hypothetical protein
LSIVLNVTPRPPTRPGIFGILGFGSLGITEPP